MPLSQMGKLNFHDGEMIYPRSHTSNLKGSTLKGSECYKPSHQILQHLGVEGRREGQGLRWKGSEMEWLRWWCLDCFCPALPSAQTLLGLCSKPVLIPHTPPHFSPQLCFVSLFAPDHYLPLCDRFVCGFSCPHQTVCPLISGILCPHFICCTKDIAPGHGLALLRSFYLLLDLCP